MANIVSKERTRKTRSRNRKAAKAASAGRPFHERRRYGLLYAALFYIICAVLLAYPAHRDSLMSLANLLPLAGKMLILLVGILTSALFLHCASPASLRDNRRALMLCTVSCLGVLAGWGVNYLHEPLNMLPDSLIAYLLPYALASLLLTILDGTVAGIASGVTVSLFMAMLLRGADKGYAATGLVIFIGGLLSSLTAVVLSDGVRKRSQVMKSAVFAGFAQLLPALADGTITSSLLSQPMAILERTGAAIICGAVVGILVLLVLPFFEAIFHRTTNITLLEYSDLSHPLLQRMAIEAPGTYHHSLVVATLAQAAADRIGANSLLTRVCCYFHDIGKLTKPGFFTENQVKENPHDELPPSMSTLIITSHVKEGVSLAHIHKLPEPIVDVIREHHGNSIIAYFHHKARKQQEAQKHPADGNGRTVDDGSFRYDGPTPRTRESGIISIADSVEAASRSLNKRSPSHIENLVNELTSKRLADGQLDQCELSLAELSAVKRSFVFTLTNMLHARVPYPKDDENRDTKQPKAGAAESPGDPQADSASDSAGNA